MLDVSGIVRLPNWFVEPDQSLKQWAGTVGGTLVAVLGLTSVVAAVLAAMAFSQVKSVKADVSAAREELMIAQEHTTRLERRLETALQNFDQQQARASEQALSITGNIAGKESRADRPAFQLTPEEIQLIRSYIKASPVTSEVTGSISVGGELRDSTLLPLPFQIAAKSPRLSGGQFRIDRNGAIVISLRKSRQVDAVIQPN